MTTRMILSCGDGDDDDAERIVVWYAQGIVMSELQCSSDEAQSLLIELSRQEGVPLESIACNVVQRSLSRPLDEVFSNGRHQGRGNTHG